MKLPRSTMDAVAAAYDRIVESDRPRHVPSRAQRIAIALFRNARLWSRLLS